ncbi:hypothetical protein TNCV_2078451 [Trichonephila clavipes]|nr:hypothetical protein TNCV_2078451 [Trichonephila clavipes]
MEVIDEIPLDVAKIYNDGSKGETNTSGSGVLIELPGHVIKFQRRNANHTSIFRTELIAIIQLIIHPSFIELAIYRRQHQQEYSSPFPTAFGSAPYSSTVVLCRPSRERSCGRPWEGGYQQSCGSGRPYGILRVAKEASQFAANVTSLSPFSPQHILQCLGFSCEEAVAPPAVLRLCTDLWTHGSGLVSLDQMGISPTTTTDDDPSL